MDSSKRLSLIVCLITFGSGLVLFTTGQSNTCNHFANCAANEAGTKVPDPTDCTRYYLCVSAIDSDGEEEIVPSNNAVDCEKDKYFYVDSNDPSLNECRDSGGAICLNPCFIRNCPSECTGDVVAAAIPNNCKQFTLCLSGGSEVESCPDSAPYFNGDECVDVYNCCDLCTPYCETAYTEVADPMNCNNYYLCTQNNTIPNEDSTACGENMYFNPTAGMCAEEDVISKCEPVCSDID